MPHKFGRQVAREVIGQAKTFLDHAEEPSIWAGLGDSKRGRMRKPDLARGRELYRAADSSMATSADHAGDVHRPSFQLDDAHSAAEHWLHDQLVHARGAFHESDDEASLNTLNAALSHSEGHSAVVADIRAYAGLVDQNNASGHALSATYLDKRSKDAILKDGLHLADAVEALYGAPSAARAERKGATEKKDDAVNQLARWLHRWALVAHRVVSPEGLARLGLAAARHHPAHRPKHPADDPPTPAPPAPAAS